MHEQPDDNDTLGRKRIRQPGACPGMLQQDRVLWGVRWTIEPVLHTPVHIGGE